MTNSSSKITFNTSRTPMATPEVQDVRKAKVQRSVTLSFDDTQPKSAATFANETQTFTESQPEFDPVPVDAARTGQHWKATTPQIESSAETAPEWQSAMEPNPFHDDVPQSQGFAQTGLMAARNDGFVQRNGTVLAVSAVVLMTFLLGLGVAMVLLNGDDATQSAQSASPTTLPDFSADHVIATRSVMPDMTQVTDLSAALAAPASDADALAQTVLAGLSPASQSAARSALEARKIEAFQVLNAVKLRMLREAVLADLYDFVPVTVNGATRIQLHTPNVEMSASFTDAALIKTIEAGQTELGKALRTPDGGIDGTTLVFTLVQKSLFADQTAESTQAALNMSRRVFATSVAQTQEVNGTRVYTVRPGDSLGYISLQFFGKVSAYKRIMQANRETLHSPDQIQIGQRIVIPS